MGKEKQITPEVVFNDISKDKAAQDEAVFESNSCSTQNQGSEYFCIVLDESKILSGYNNQKNFFDISIPSVLLIIIGWGVIYNNAKKLATRNETKSLIDDVVSQIDKLEKIAVDYWLSGRQARMDTDAYLLLINAKIQTLSYRIKIISQRKINTQRLDLGKFSELMTLNCEEVDKQTPEYKREQMQSFLNEINESVEYLYNEFQKSYSPSFTFLS